MSKTIFDRGNSKQGESLVMNDDGTLTYTRSHGGWAAARTGAKPETKVFSVEEAKAQWPRHAAEIDEAARSK